MLLHRIAIMLLLIAGAGANTLEAQNYNYPDRRAFIVNNCPHVELADFSFRNEYASDVRRIRFRQDIGWTNVGTQPLVAFEIVILKYDAYDRRLIGSRWSVTGKNSADWRPLAPGESNSDGTRGLGSEEVFTAIAYVRSARLADGTVWRADFSDLGARLRDLRTGIEDLGDVEPDPPARERDGG